MGVKEIISQVILTAIVFAAFVTSIANMIISLMNNHRLKKLEKQKVMNAIDKYRYSRLYELVLNWHNYDSPHKGENAGEIACNRLINLFLDDVGRYELAKPLLDECYKKEIEEIISKGEEVLHDLIEKEEAGNRTKEFLDVQQKYFDAGKDLDHKLKEAINVQLDKLLFKS